MFSKLCDGAYLMIQNLPGKIKFAPLFICSFQLLVPHHVSESEKFNILFPNPSKITATADKLRWYRHKRALLQREVAGYIGINTRTYASYEQPDRDYYPIEDMEKLAVLFSVPVTNLLDDFNLFLYHNQGKQLRERRMKLGMTINEYAGLLGVNPDNLRRWEANKVRILKSTWERYFK